MSEMEQYLDKMGNKPFLSIKNGQHSLDVSINYLI